MAVRFINPFAPEFDTQGVMLDRGKLAFTASTTDTDVLIKTDLTQDFNVPNPVTLDGAGRTDVWLPTPRDYRVKLLDREDNQVAYVDPLVIREVVAAEREFQITTPYDINDVTRNFNGDDYVSLKDDNIGNPPSTNSQDWTKYYLIHIFNPLQEYVTGDIAIINHGLYQRKNFGWVGMGVSDSLIAVGCGAFSVAQTDSVGTEFTVDVGLQAQFLEVSCALIPAPPSQSQGGGNFSYGRAYPNLPSPAILNQFYTVIWIGGDNPGDRPASPSVSGEAQFISGADIVDFVDLVSGDTLKMFVSEVTATEVKFEISAITASSTLDAHFIVQAYEEGPGVVVTP